ncbi:hypothetical protein S40288_11585 [Stachybotrys chartarum IBT 40288]|nr:hypothetical protein S40288_11585 [Stachybotrys chartarum IBT 40288]
MASLLRDQQIKKYNILAIQEPWRNPFQNTTHHPAKDKFFLCYPTQTDGHPAQVCFFVNKRLDNLTWHFKEHSQDLCSIIVSTREEEGEAKQIAITNIYNSPQRTEGRASAVVELGRMLDSLTNMKHVVVGDFNLHHEIWDGTIEQSPEAETEDLISTMDAVDVVNTTRRASWLET